MQSQKSEESELSQKSFPVSSNPSLSSTTLSYSSSFVSSSISSTIILSSPPSSLDSDQQAKFSSTSSSSTCTVDGISTVMSSSPTLSLESSSSIAPSPPSSLMSSPSTASPPATSPQISSPPTNSTTTSSPPINSPPTNSPPTPTPSTNSPPTSTPPTNSPPTPTPPTNSPPTSTPPTNSPPTPTPSTNSPPTSTPPTNSPPTPTPPTNSPPTSTPPTNSPPTPTPPTNSPPTSTPPTNSTTTSSPSDSSSSAPSATTMSPDSTIPDTIEMRDKIQDEMKNSLMKLREMSSWSTPDAAQLTKGIGALYWKAEGYQQQVADAFCELQGSELFIDILIALNKEGLFSKNPTWQTAFYIYNTLWNLSDASLALALRLGQRGMIKLCTTNISHKPYRDNMAQKNVSFLIKASLNILHNLAKAPGNKHVYREEKVIENMEPFLEGDPYLKAISMMTLAYIIEEGQEEILAEKGTNTIEYLVEILKDAQNSKDKRCQGLSDKEVTDALGRLACHDNNKHKIVEAGGLPLMISMLHDECVETQEAAATAIWNLTFSDDVCEKLRSNTDCMQVLQELSTSSSSEVAKAANGALWVINKEGEKKDQAENGDESGSREKVSRKQPHVMISYQWGCQPLVLKMRDALKKAGYNIWVDVDCMYGSTLQAMAEAIENACAIVMCMSERYKESPNCRTEAEYAFQLRKRIIPVMMEEYYRPDGWLGIILGAKFYMDFSGRLALEEEMNKLIKEVQVAVEATIINTDDTDDGVVVGASISFPLESAGISVRVESMDWTVAQVQDWLTENDLDHLRPVMAEYNGRLLHQLYKMRQDASDFFYSSIKEEFGLIRLIDILRFTEALDSLLKE